MIFISKVHLVGGARIWQLSLDVYHMLDAFAPAFLVPAFLLLSGSALRLTAIAVVVHEVSHLTTDFESSIMWLNRFSTKSFSVHLHCFVDVFFALQIFVIGFFMDEGMGVTRFAASIYRGLGYLLLTSYPFVVLRLLEMAPKNPFVSFLYGGRAKKHPSATIEGCDLDCELRI
eukprot:TRINITY_DN13588_c0_g2_i1.p1 TRINITY_DN13588_c0_g2~~TRINITY_DN13588_c0_g2_i1.p1  ORF type:complete len:173 (+),score=17.65 TRINITY_DN13588_c0_g2_i1:41-559(+)